MKILINYQMKKYQKRQNKIQSSSRKRLMMEKRIVRLMHERALLNKFDSDNENVAMYNAIVNGVKDEKGNVMEVNYDELDSTNKKVYNFCKKFIMMNDIEELNQMEEERLALKAEMQSAHDGYTHDKLKKKYKEMGEKCNEFYKKMTESSESKKLFNLCKLIGNVHTQF